MANTTNYLLRDIDPAAWARFKARAQANGLAMRELLLLLVDAYADGHVAVRPRVTRPGQARLKSARPRAPEDK